jgi:hypothetical protein
MNPPETGPVETLPPAPAAPAPLPYPVQHPYTPGYPPPLPRTNPLSVASLVLGIVWLGGLGSLLAVIFGHIGLGQIKRARGQQSGRGLALAGTIVGYVGCIGAIAIAALLLTATSTHQFSAQQAIGQDSEAKANARNLVSQVESCSTDYSGDYTNCASNNLSNTGLSMGSKEGQVETTDVSTSTYTIVATSKSGNSFAITKDPSGVTTRSCTSPGEGGCDITGAW